MITLRQYLCALALLLAAFAYSAIRLKLAMKQDENKTRTWLVRAIFCLLVLVFAMVFLRVDPRSRDLSELNESHYGAQR